MSHDFSGIFIDRRVAEQVLRVPFTIFCPIPGAGCSETSATVKMSGFGGSVDLAQQARRGVEPKKPGEPVGASEGSTDWVELAVLLRDAQALIGQSGSSPVASRKDR